MTQDISPEYIEDLATKSETERYPFVANSLRAQATRIAELEAASAWQPIETAPKDGTDVLCHNPTTEHYAVCWWSRGYWLYGDDVGDEGNYPYMSPTHWQPLPTPPVKEGE